jgi:RNA recognition motif-containing protein
VGDLPFADVKPPENVLFVCRLNPVTRDEDLDLIFSRFGPIVRYMRAAPPPPAPRRVTPAGTVKPVSVSRSGRRRPCRLTLLHTSSVVFTYSPDRHTTHLGVVWAVRK